MGNGGGKSRDQSRGGGLVAAKMRGIIRRYWFKSRRSIMPNPNASMTLSPEEPWLDLMIADLGTHEIAGPEANPKIVQCFANVGHPECTSHAVARRAAIPRP